MDFDTLSVARATLSHAPPATESALAIGEFYFTFNFKKNILNYELRFGDFSEIDTRGGARDFQSRRPTPPRAYSEYKVKTAKPKTAEPAHMAGTFAGSAFG